MDSATDTSVSDMDRTISKNVSGYIASRQWKGYLIFKVIPQKLNLPMNFFETSLESSLLSTVSKKTMKMIGHHSR